MEENWGVASAAYHAGEIEFAEFAKRTERQRKSWIGKMRRQLEPIPVWHSSEDSEQDFLLNNFVKRDGPSSTLRAPVYYRLGLRQVGKIVQKARGVEQHRRSGTPRFERTFTSVFFDGPPEMADPSRENDLERTVLRREYYEVLRGLCDTPKQLAVVCALQAGGGSLAGATVQLLADPDLRRDLQLDSERDATSTIDCVVRELISAYGKKEEEAQS